MSNESTASPTFSENVDAIESILAAEEQELDEAEQETEDSAADDADDESEESETDEGEDSQPQAKTFKVKIDGEEVEVPEDELIKGYSRTQDYTRKTQALAEQRKQAESEYEAVRGEREQYSQLLGMLSAKLEQEPTVDESLQYTDPIAYAQQLSQYMQWERDKKAIDSERQRVAQTQKQEHEAYLQRYVSEQQERLTTLIPEWLDETVAKTEKAKIAASAKEYGYSDEELSNLFDARAVAMMRDAMRFRELVAKRQEIKPKATPAVSSKPAKRSSEIATAKQRLAKSGSVKDAASLISRML